MTRCRTCGRRLWPWQGRGPRIKGPEHYHCYELRYERLLDLTIAQFSHNSQAFWEVVLTAPKHVSDELLRRHDEAHR